MQFNKPECWAEENLDNLATFIDYRGKTPVKTNTGVPLITAKNIKDGYINREPREYIALYDYDSWMTRGFPKVGDVLITTEAPMGNVALVDISEVFALAQRAICLQFFYAQMSNYAHYALRSPVFQRALTANSTGTTVSGIKASTLKMLRLPIPPLAEQKVIADKLDTLLAQVDNTKARLERIPEILKSFRQSVLAAAVSGKLTEEWRASNTTKSNLLAEIQHVKTSWAISNPKHNESKRILKRVKEFQSSKSISFDELPNNWTWQYLEDCVLMIVDCHNKTAPYVLAGIPLIRTSNIRDGQFVWRDLKYVDNETYDYWSKRCTPEQGDLIFTREAPMGEAAIIQPNQKVCLGQRTMLIRPIETHISASYLLLAIMDPNFKKRSDLVAVGTGVKHYRVGDVSNLLIPVPSREEQTEIVRRVDELFAFANRIEQAAQAAQSRVNNLPQSILAKAFRGELTADWRTANPDLISGDNSAEALLAKIKAERAKVKTRKKA